MDDPKAPQHTPYPGGPIAIGYQFGDKRPLDQLGDSALVEVASWCIEELLRRDVWHGAISIATMKWTLDILKRGPDARKGKEVKP